MIVFPQPESEDADLAELVQRFCEEFKPLESERLLVLVDQRTGAYFAECHVKASLLVQKATTDVPLDPDNSPEFRANRELVEDHDAFQNMKSDAAERRRFSNIVCEYIEGEDKPLKVIGGQHRFEAISEALQSDVDTEHGIKVYFELDNEQRLDVQVISNTNIAVSKDLLDRMYETLAGKELREWCQKCGLLDKGQDFSDKTKGGNPLTVREARTFIVNYYRGLDIGLEKFEAEDTTPRTVRSGVRDPKEWAEVKSKHPTWWEDKGLQKAGKAYAKLMRAQSDYFFDPKTKKYKGAADQRRKARNIALLSGWAFVAGALQGNDKRLKRHYDIPDTTNKDPLRSEVLAKGRHSTDPENYRGLGFRTDSKECGRFAELFWLQAEKGHGITSQVVDAAIKKYQAKQAILDAKASMAKIK